MSAQTYSRVIGMQARDASDTILGTITSVEVDEGGTFAVIDEAFEISLIGSAEIMDLTNGTHYVRIKC